MKIKPSLLLLPLALAGCVAPKPQPAPPRPAAPAPQPAPRPAPTVPAPQVSEWQDMPLSPGDWTYGEEAGVPQAAFGPAGRSFVMRCDRGARQVRLLRPGVTTGNTMVVNTSDAVRTLPISVMRDGSATPYAALGADDPLLDAIALSRGRFSIHVPGLPMLIIPSWAEPTRLIEECRG